MLWIVDFEYRRRDAFKTPAVIIRSILKGVVRDPPDVPPNRSRPVLRRLDPHEEIDGFRIGDVRIESREIVNLRVRPQDPQQLSLSTVDRHLDGRVRVVLVLVLGGTVAFPFEDCNSLMWIGAGPNQHVRSARLPVASLLMISSPFIRATRELSQLSATVESGEPGPEVVRTRWALREQPSAAVRRRGGIRHANRARASKTDPPLTRRALGGYGWFRKLLQGLVELMGIEPMTS